MKQYITKKQWEEIDEGDKILWIKQFCIQTRSVVIPCSDDFKQDLFPNIGQMIEFLGDDLDRIILEKREWFVYLKDFKIDDKFELCDALWEAVKYKLKI